MPSVLSRSSGNDAAKVSGLIDVPTAKAALSGITSTLTVKPDTKVVYLFTDLPDEVQAEARAQKSNERNTKGLFHSGTLYLVTTNHSTLEDLHENIMHELIGHFGTRKLLGPQFIQKSNQIFAQLGGLDGLRAIAQKHG